MFAYQQDIWITVPESPWPQCCHPSPKLHHKLDASIRTPTGGYGLDGEGWREEGEAHTTGAICHFPRRAPRRNSREGAKHAYQVPSGAPARRARNSTMVIFYPALRAMRCWQLTVIATISFFLMKTAFSTLGPKGTLEGERNKQGKSIVLDVFL